MESDQVAQDAPGDRLQPRGAGPIQGPWKSTPEGASELFAKGKKEPRQRPQTRPASELSTDWQAPDDWRLKKKSQLPDAVKMRKAGRFHDPTRNHESAVSASLLATQHHTLTTYPIPWLNPPWIMARTDALIWRANPEAVGWLVIIGPKGIPISRDLCPNLHAVHVLTAIYQSQRHTGQDPKVALSRLVSPQESRKWIRFGQQIFTITPLRRLPLPVAGGSVSRIVLQLEISQHCMESVLSLNCLLPLGKAHRSPLPIKFSHSPVTSVASSNRGRSRSAGSGSRALLHNILVERLMETVKYGRLNLRATAMAGKLKISLSHSLLSTAM